MSSVSQFVALDDETAPSCDGAMQPSRASLRAKRSNPERFTRNLDCFVASLLANDEADFDLDQFHRNRGRFAAADAQAGDAARLAVALERGDQRREDARAAGADRVAERGRAAMRSEGHTSELQSLLSHTYALFC